MKKLGGRKPYVTIKGMYTQLHWNFHQLLLPKRLLITDTTQNQPFPTNWKNTPSEIETLISYSAHDDGINWDAFEIEYSQYMTANRFMAAQNAIDAHHSVVVTWSAICLQPFTMLDYQLSYPQQ